MKNTTLPSLAILICAFLLLSISPFGAGKYEPYLSYGTNILPDPSFEGSLAGDLGEYAIESKAHSGSRSIQVSLNWEQAEQKEKVILGLDPVTVEPNSLYKLEVWVHIPENIIAVDKERSIPLKPNERSFYGALLRADLINKGNENTGSGLFGTTQGKQQLDLSHNTHGGWVQLRGLVKTTEEAHSLKIWFGLEQDVGTAYFDDFSLSKIDNPNDFLCMFESPEARDDRIGWWKESGYGMFPIFGLYSIHGGEWRGTYFRDLYAEWLTHRTKISHGEMQALAEVFKPHAFDANEFVRLAQAAGMGHIIITAKYHDGFAMWPTECDTFNIKDASRFDRDVLKELAEACRKAGIHLGFYYSQSQEWYTPGGFNVRYHAFGPFPEEFEWSTRRRYWEPDIAPFDLTRNYLENKGKPQLVELMERYNPEVIWFDVPSEINVIDSLEMLAIVRKHNPHCLAGSRLHASTELRDFRTLGDYDVPEGQIREDYWESLPGMQKFTYSYDQFQPFRSPEEIYKELKGVRQKGGNYLLAIGGPKGDGSIPAINFEILRKVKELADAEGILQK